MAPYFFLSYAVADSHPLVLRFFQDLSQTISSKLHDYSSVVGFFDDTASQNDQWSPATAEALRTSHVIVPLLSPAYFRDKRVGKQLRVFEMRRQQYLERSGNSVSAELLSSVITPV